MILEEVMDILINGYKEGKKVIRLHTGDPAIYSSISEQIAILNKKDIPYKVIPGVTAGLAAASTLATELTIPNVTQTVIISRIGGRTPVPQKESLKKLSQIQASLILYLSISYIEKVVEELLSGYPSDTPVAVVEKVGWPSERIIRGTLSDIAQKVYEAGIKKTAVIIVGDALKGVTDFELHKSKLYSKYFSHGFRKALFEKREILEKFFTKRTDKEEKIIVYLGESGENIAKKVKSCPLLRDADIISFSDLKKRKIFEEKWNTLSTVVFIGAVAISVRTIAPFLKNKYEDPAVISIDESCKNVVCILSGHLGGGNKICKKIADFLDANPVITTQSDLSNLPPIDLWLRAQNLIPMSLRGLKNLQAKFRNRNQIKIFVHELINIKSLPEGFEITYKKEQADLIITPYLCKSEKGLVVTPRCMCLGVGCHKDIKPSLLLKRLFDFLNKNKIEPFSIERICTIDKKANEPAIKTLCKELLAELYTFKANELESVPGILGSDLVKGAVGAKAVSEPASILCANGGKFLIKKEKYPDCTFALSMLRFTINDNY